MKLLSIPEYFKTYVDPSIDLSVTHNIPCPFHNEQHGKSFTYSPDKNLWRCWGACHFGGDVISLHQLHHRIKTREQAKVSLYKLLGLKLEETAQFIPKEVHIDKIAVERKSLYSKACSLATTPEAYVDLDYILSQVPFEVDDLKNFIQKYEEVHDR